MFQDKDRAGSSSVTFLVSGLDDQFAELKAKGISIERTTTSDYVKTATVTDPAGTGRRDFRLTKNGVPGERAWNDVSIVDVATCTVTRSRQDRRQPMGAVHRPLGDE